MNLKLFNAYRIIDPWILVVTMRYSIDSLDVCFGDQLAGSAHEPMLRGCTRFRLDSPVETLGALFEVLCVGLNIMNLKLFDAYCIINSRILVVTLEYLGDIRVLVDLCLKVLF